MSVDQTSWNPLNDMFIELAQENGEFFIRIEKQ